MAGVKGTVLEMPKIKDIFLVFMLLAFILAGAFLRSERINKELEVINGFEFFVNMASNYRVNPGSYDFEESLKMKSDPENYIFTRNGAKKAVATFENEKGWAFLLNFVIPEGTKGIKNIALIIAKWQLALDIFVIALLFYSGRAIAGPFGACFAAVLYAFSPLAIRMTGWVSYYYMAIPLSAASIFFWTNIYSPEIRPRSTNFTFFSFLGYGMIMGLATAVRLNFVFLPVFMSPVIFMREHNFKKAALFLAAMLIGQALLLAPQVHMTHKFYGKWALSTRGTWHNVIQGLGAHPNPWGVKDVQDLTAVKWSIDHGGPDLNKAGFHEYDKFMKQKAMTFFRERPDIFIRNAYINIREGMTLRAYSSGKPMSIIDRSFPYLLGLVLIALFFKNRNSFLILLSVIFQGLYFLIFPLIYFPNTITFFVGYAPVYSLLLSLMPAFFMILLVSQSKRLTKQC